MKLTREDYEAIADAIKKEYTSGRLDCCNKCVSWELKYEIWGEGEKETNGCTKKVEEETELG